MTYMTYMSYMPYMSYMSYMSFMSYIYSFIFINPTSPLGDKWFRVRVESVSTIPSIPLFPTSLEEGFSPPPPSSLGSGSEWSRAPVATYIRLFRHPGHHHFFIIFSTPFSYQFLFDFDSQLEAKRSQERSGKLPTFCMDFSSDFDGLEGCWNLVFELLASTGSKISTF